MSKIISVKIGAEAGQGVKSAGLLLAKLATRSGYHIYNHVEYPSLIRGGLNVIQVNISKDEVYSPSKVNNLLIALNQNSINKLALELAKTGGLLFDSEKEMDTSKVSKEAILYGVPFSQLAQKAGEANSLDNTELLINTVALGATTSILGGNISILTDLIAEEFNNKGESIIKSNIAAAKSGFDYATEQYKEHLGQDLTPLDTLNTFIPSMLINGNDAVALGAISAGLQFAAIYPMSPISDILHILAKHQEKFGYIYKQPEDEIAAINMAIGASYAGARSMVATSGGGFCLMTEGYGLAGMTETPLVIVDGMRPGPATGLPTWSEQGDLQMILNAHQGDFPRIVLAAGDAKETFDLTLQAFNLADIYQTPVVLIIDKNICENNQSFPFFDLSNYKIDRGNFTTEKLSEYQRYKYCEDGISQRSIPGIGNYFSANSDEHDQIGYSTEDIEARNKMMQKRMAKLDTCRKNNMEAPQLYGPELADITIISWGSNKGSILQALKNLEKVNYVHITWMSPFPSEALAKLVAKSKHILNVECNYTGHMARLIRENTNIKIDTNLFKYDGRPFYPEEIIEKVKTLRSSQ